MEQSVRHGIRTFRMTTFSLPFRYFPQAKKEANNGEAGRYLRSPLFHGSAKCLYVDMAQRITKEYRPHGNRLERSNQEVSSLSYA